MAGAYNRKEMGKEMAWAYNKYGVAGKHVAEAPPVAAAKRRRADFDNPGSLNLSSFYTREDGRGETRVVVDTDPIGASYDFYLQCSKMSPYIGGESSRSVDGWLDEHPIDIGVRGSNPARRHESRRSAVGGGRPKSSVPGHTSAIEQQMSPYIGGESSRFVDGGLDEHPIDISVRGSDPARRKESQRLALGGGRPKSSVPGHTSAIEQQMLPYIGGESSRFVDGELDEHPIDISVRGSDSARRNESRWFALGGGRPKSSVLFDTSRTLFVQGLPLDCTCREVSHLFRPFIGYEEVRLVRKEPRHPGGDPAVICFVDFASPAHAATAKDALQGYKFDELDPRSVCLRLQFALYPAARSGGGHR